MAIHESSVVRNRLLAALSPDDFDRLLPKLVRVPLRLGAVLIEAHRPIGHVLFPESGLISTVAVTVRGRVEVGLIGCEGMSGVPVILGTNQTPHTYLVQGVGAALRISAQDLRAAIAAHPSIFRPLGLYAQALITQMAETIYSNTRCNLDVRLARWILMTQDRAQSDDLQLTHEFLSAMLGVGRPGVTITTHALEGLGLIRNTRGHIVVRDRDRLLEMAGDTYQVGRVEADRLADEARDAASTLHPPSA